MAFLPPDKRDLFSSHHQHRRRCCGDGEDDFHGCDEYDIDCDQEDQQIQVQPISLSVYEHQRISFGILHNIHTMIVNQGGVSKSRRISDKLMHYFI